MFEILKNLLFFIMCLCLVVSIFATILPTGQVDEDGNPIFMQMSFKDFLKLLPNAPLIKTDWVNKIRINVATIYDEDGNLITYNPKPNSLNIGELIKWGVQEVFFNPSINYVVNTYILLPIRAIMLILTIVINIFIFVGWCLLILFGGIPMPAV